MDPTLQSRYVAGLAAAIASAGAPAASLPQWNLVGPDLTTNGQTMTDGVRVPVSGRVGAIAIDPSNTNHVLCGSAAGGIWESFTRGADWAPRTDAMLTLTIGAISFDPTTPATVYAGTGEGNSYWFFGQGILRSTDGGTTWALLTAGPFAGQGFYKIIVDPANGQHILAATTGGIYESADGGATWSQQYAIKTYDLAMAPAGGPTAEVLAGADDGVHQSTDGGHTWAALAMPGAPPNWTRIAVSIAPSDPTTALVYGTDWTDDKPFLWRRSDRTWSAVPTPTSHEGQSFYDWCVAVAPDRIDQVYVGAFDIYRGDLAAGTWTWTNLSTKAQGDCIHPDIHTFVFDPADPATIYCGCDGGVFRSPNRGVSWTALNCGLSIAEVEYLTQDSRSSRWLLAGTQDTASIRHLGTSTFEGVADGDGGDCGADQANPGTCYHSWYNMGLAVSTTGGGSGSFAEIGPHLDSSVYKSLFYPPVAVSGGTAAQAGQSAYLTRDKGKNWTEVKLPAGELATALCAPGGDLIYVGTQAGNLYKITYSGGAWSRAVGLTSPRAAYVSTIVAPPPGTGRMWVTISQLGGSTVFRSEDGGTTWADKTAGLPAIPANSLAVDNTNADRVWVSADVGVYQSLDGGTTWSAFYRNLPNVLVADLEFHVGSRRLRAATRSRGIWEVAVDQAGSSLLPAAVSACAVVINHGTGIQVFGAGTGKSLGYWYQAAVAGDWSGQQSLGGVATSAVAAAANQDQGIEAFARGADGALCHVRQSATDWTWSAWASLGGLITGNPTVAKDQAGCLGVFARGTDGALRHIYQTAPGGPWSSWESLGGVITSTPAAALNADGRMEVFARGVDGSLVHIYQTTAGGPWSSWEPVGGGPPPGGILAGKPVVARNSDGRMEVFARGGDGALVHLHQANAPASGQSGRPGGNWSAWESLGGVLTGDPAVAPNSDGRLEVFGRGTDNAAYHIWQNTAGGTTASDWSSWQSLTGTITSDPVAILNQNGQVEVFARWSDNAIWHVWQTAGTVGWDSGRGDGWSVWLSLNGAVLTFPS